MPRGRAAATRIARASSAGGIGTPASSSVARIAARDGNSSGSMSPPRRGASPRELGREDWRARDGGRVTDSARRATVLGAAARRRGDGAGARF